MAKMGTKHFDTKGLKNTVVILILLICFLCFSRLNASAASGLFTLGPIPTPVTEDVSGTAANVSDATQLRNALLNQSVTQIILNNDITLTGAQLNDVSATAISRSLMIDGQGHLLTVRQSAGVHEAALLLRDSANNPRRVLILKNLRVAGGRTLNSSNTYFFIEALHSNGVPVFEVILDNFEYENSASPFSTIVGCNVSAGDGQLVNLFFRNKVSIARTTLNVFLRPGNVVFEPGSQVNVQPSLTASQGVFRQLNNMNSGVYVGNNAVVSVDGGPSSVSVFSVLPTINVYPGAVLDMVKSSSPQGVVWSGNGNIEWDMRVDSGASVRVVNGNGPAINDRSIRHEIVANDGASVEIIGNVATDAIVYTGTDSRIILDNPAFYNIQNRNNSGRAISLASGTVPQLQLLNTGIAVWAVGSNNEGQATAPSPFSNISLLVGNAGPLSGSSPELNTMPGGWLTSRYSRFSVAFGVDFDLNGGEGTPPPRQTVFRGGMVAEPPDPAERAGHTFIGWNTAADGSGSTWNFAMDTLTSSSITLYAQWRANSYMMHFHLNGGDGQNPPSQPVVFGTMAAEVPDPVKNGFTFNGWNTQSDGGGSEWNFASDTMPANEVNLFAQWTRNNYDVTFNLNGGDGTAPETQSIAFQDFVVPVADPVRLGHVFLSWNTQSDGSGTSWDFGSNRMPAGPITLYAQWALDNFNMHFNLNGGSGIAPDSQEILFGNLATAVPDPSREGHAFLNWNTQQDGGGTTWVFESTPKPAQDTTLFAQWQVNNYTLSFDLQGGDGPAPTPQQLDFESLAAPVTDPTRTGNTFVGWNTAPDGTGSGWDFATSRMPAAPTTLYAQWEVDSFNLNFHVNGGQSAAPPTQVVPFGARATAVEIPQRTGFGFSGWNTQQDGNGVTWNFSSDTMPANDLTLYAQWDVNSFTADFNVNGGDSAPPAPQTVAFDQFLTNPGDAARTGYHPICPMANQHLHPFF